MRRLLTVLVALALLAAACGSTTETVDAAAGLGDAAEVEAPAVAEEATAAVDATEADDIAAEAEVADDVADTTTTTPESTLLPSGRERILANHSEGKPYVLWYWGAH